jgi:uncharacterized protein YfaS (alpha-2-macroglobulin family)
MRNQGSSVPGNRWTIVVVIAVLFALVASACTSDPRPQQANPLPTPVDSSTTQDDAVSAEATNETQVSASGPVSIRLTEGASTGADAALPIEVVSGESLAPADVAAIFDRLPPLAEQDHDTQAFNRPPESLPPPSVGDTISQAFPSSDDLDIPAIPDGPLEVVRFQPEGPVAIAPAITITFNQPMVPIATLGQLAAADVPATITPDIAGQWEWIGTTTLRFEHDSAVIDRLPMSTDYVVEIPAGTSSVTGATLPRTAQWTFQTPPPRVMDFRPKGDDKQLEPIFVVQFDQQVDPAAVLEIIVLTADQEPRPIRLATQEEIDVDGAAIRRVGRATPGQFIAFRAVDPFDPDTELSVTVGPNTPSAEGPRTADTSETFSAHTFKHLQVANQSCKNGGCEPSAGFSIRFNNELNPNTFDPDAFVIEPALAGAFVQAGFNDVFIAGDSRGRTDYRVTIPGSLGDVFGQTLGEDQTLTFKVGAARPQLHQMNQTLVTTDPYLENPAVSVTSVNHDDLQVDIFSVDPTPADWSQYERFLNQRHSETPPDLSVWNQLSSSVVTTRARDDQLTETAIDLSAVLEDNLGHVVVRVSSTTEYDGNTEDYFWNLPVLIWVQATDIGLDAIVDADELFAWATDLRTGEPLGDVAIQIGADPAHAAQTNADGLATLASPTSRTTLVAATRGADTAIVPNVGLFRPPKQDVSRWHIFDDRGLYRPGETVNIKGWLRDLTLSGDAQLAPIGNEVAINYVARDSRGNTLSEGPASLSSLGGFDFSFEVPLGANLGTGWIEFKTTGRPSENGEVTHPFQVQEFRRPEFEVRTRVDSVGPYIKTDPVTVAAEATYFSGGPLPDADVDWRVFSSDAVYAPPGWNAFEFGTWVPWWSERGLGRGIEGGFESVRGQQPAEVFTGRTDANGEHYLQLDFGADHVDQPITVNAQASVTDVNRQTWSSDTNLLIHPASVYVGLRSDRTFVRKGEPLQIASIVTDIDGTAIPQRAISITAGRLQWQYSDDRWEQVAVDSQGCDLTSTFQEQLCAFDTAVGGTYRIVAVVTDEFGRTNRSEVTRWVSGAQQAPDRGLQLEAITLVPDKETYEPGDVAEILVEAPFEGGTGLLTLARNGVLATSTFELDGTTAVIEIAVEDRYIPGFDIQVEVVGASERTADDGTPLPEAIQRPAFASGQLTLAVPPTSRTLKVEAIPADDSLEPGAKTSLTVDVTDAQGNPVVDAELTVIVVDEAVLALTDYQLPDPLDTFYAPIGANTGTWRGRSTIVLDNPASLDKEIQTRSGRFDGEDGATDDSSDGQRFDSPAAAPAAELGSRALSDGAPAGDVGGGPPIEVRTNFDALAVYEPEVTTDAQGRAVIDVPLPDNLTRYRVMVLAVDGADQFGSGESNITARLPLQVRPSAPRFLNFGDVFELPVIVQNQTNDDLVINLAIEATNLALPEGQGRQVTVPANNRIEVRFPAAAEQAGTARFRVAAVSVNPAAVSGQLVDAATISLPVYAPATAEAFATYGVVDDGGVVRQPVLAPTEVWPQFGGLEINTSSTALQALTDAMLYVNNYRYNSSDGYASRILAVSALRDVLDAFDAEGLPAPDVLNRRIASDIASLVALQNGDGGFGIWKLGEESWPYHSAHASHALVEARANGYDVSDTAINNSLDYLSRIGQRIPDTYSPRARTTLRAYALHIRHLAGDTDTARAEALWAEASGDDEVLTLEATAWLWGSIADAQISAEIERRFTNRAVGTASAATFVTDYGDEAYLLLHSNHRTDGIILDALIAQRPGSDLITKVVAGLLGGQTRGRWKNMQENTFILLALNKYFDTFEAVDPDFVARVWLGELYAAEHEYLSRTTDRNETVVPMSELIAQGDSDLVVSQDGNDGRLYYRLGLRYAPRDLDLDPLDRGFVVTRSYEAIDDPDDVTLDGAGVWHIRAGADVTVRITMVAQSRRTHVGLVDPLPAGLEPLNPALVATPDILPTAQDAEIRRFGSWFGHQNLRDDRAEAFSSHLRAGIYDYSYVVSATTPGTFVTPPTRAEEIFTPETFGRSGTDIVVIV